MFHNKVPSNATPNHSGSGRAPLPQLSGGRVTTRSPGVDDETVTRASRIGTTDKPYTPRVSLEDLSVQRKRSNGEVVVPGWVWDFGLGYQGVKRRGRVSSHGDPSVLRLRFRNGSSSSTDPVPTFTTLTVYGRDPPCPSSRLRHPRLTVSLPRTRVHTRRGLRRSDLGGRSDVSPGGYKFLFGPLGPGPTPRVCRFELLKLYFLKR